MEGVNGFSCVNMPLVSRFLVYEARIPPLFWLYPAIPPHSECLFRSRLITAIRFAVCDLPLFIPHLAVNFKTISRVVTQRIFRTLITAAEEISIPPVWATPLPPKKFHPPSLHQNSRHTAFRLPFYSHSASRQTYDGARAGKHFFLRKFQELFAKLPSCRVWPDSWHCWWLVICYIAGCYIKGNKKIC